MKIFGAIELWRTHFHYAQDTVFNASTYGAFLERLGRHYRRRGAMLIGKRLKRNGSLLMPCALDYLKVAGIKNPRMRTVHFTSETANESFTAQPSEE